MIPLKNYTLLQKWASEVRGVFTINDLRNLFNQPNDVLLYRQIRTFEKEGILSRFKKGFYITDSFDPEILTCRMYHDAYISLGTVLAKQLLIGSVPKKTTYAVKTGRTRIFSGSGITISYYEITPELMFGYTTENGIRQATAEKAFLDTLYFYQKGRKFSFDIYSDIDRSRLDVERIISWLPKYKNQKFISFVKGMLNG